MIVVSVGAGCGACSDAIDSGWEFDEDTDLADIAEDQDADSSAADVRPLPDLGVLPTCGDGIVDDGEVCDGEALAGATCETFGFGGGQLECMDGCAGYLVSACRGVPDWTPTRPHPCASCEDYEVCAGSECEATCAGEPVADISQLDVDVRTHRVEVRVTIGGRPLADWVEDESMGEVIFKPHRGVATRLQVDPDGLAEGEAYEGLYNVYWHGRLDRPSLPLLLASEVRVDSDVNLELDADEPEPTMLRLTAPDWFGAFEAEVTLRLASESIPGIQVTRHFNQPAPEHSMELAARHPRVGRVSLDSPQPASEAMDLTLPIGPVDIWIRVAREDGPSEQWIARDVEVTAQGSATTDFEPVQTVSLRGEVVRRGERIPDNDQTRTISDSSTGQTREEVISRGTLQFRCVDDCLGSASWSLGGTGAAVYDVELATGVYQVSLRTPAGSDWNLPTPQDVLPSPGYVLHPALEVSESGRRDFDIRLDRLELSMTEDGQTLSELRGWSQSARDRGTRGSAGISRHPVSQFGASYPFRPHQRGLGERGEVQEVFFAYPGHYTLGVNVGGTRVKRALEIDGPRELDLDISLAHLDGNLRWNGGSWQSQRRNGHIAFVTPRVWWSAGLQLAGDGGFSATVHAEPSQVMWRQRQRATSSSRPRGQFVLFDGCTGDP